MLNLYLYPMLHPSLLLQPMGKRGRGMVTTEPLDAGLIIEIAPVIVMDLNDRALIDQTLLHDYIFEWGENKNQCAMALGHIPMYNHSSNSNCEYFMDFENETIFVKTVRKIDVEEELTINYNGDWDNDAPVWFTMEQD